LISQIRIHSNPFKLDYENIYQHTYCNLYGSLDVIPQMVDDIKEYSLDSDDGIWTVALKGKPGAGKSLFARCLVIETLKKQKEILSDQNRIRMELDRNKYYP